jgi:hypothetical protein
MLAIHTTSFRKMSRYFQERICLWDATSSPLKMSEIEVEILLRGQEVAVGRKTKKHKDLIVSDFILLFMGEEIRFCFDSFSNGRVCRKTLWRSLRRKFCKT